MELKIRHCTLQIEHLLPLESLHVRKVTEVKSEWIVDGQPYNCAVASIFSHSLEELAVEYKSGDISKTAGSV